MEVPIEKLMKRIDILKPGCQFYPIKKGFSLDKKYMVTTESGEKLLLRVMPEAQFNRKDTEFRIIQQMYLANVKVPQPVSIGKFDDLLLCYYVLSYIEGFDAEEALKDYSLDIQFNIGVEAGIDLRRMHQYHAPTDVAPWYERVMKKHRTYVEAYKKIGVSVRKADKIIEFIETCEPCLRNRPNRFQHDDFHVGNIIVNDGNYAGVIDFNRYDWGDPLHDFLKVGFFSSQVSVPFSIGQLRGYFKSELIPDYFWRLYSVYVAMSVFASVVWTMRVVPENIDGMMERINRVLEDHRYFESMKPSWLREFQT